jgi:hypothetical protein
VIQRCTHEIDPGIALHLVCHHGAVHINVQDHESERDDVNGL